MDYENIKIKGIHISRYIASWLNVTGGRSSKSMLAWLEQLEVDGERLTLDEIWRILNFARSGRFELESDAERFIGKTEHIHEET